LNPGSFNLEPSILYPLSYGVSLTIDRIKVNGARVGKSSNEVIGDSGAESASSGDQSHTTISSFNTLMIPAHVTLINKHLIFLTAILTCVKKIQLLSFEMIMCEILDNV